MSVKFPVMSLKLQRYKEVIIGEVKSVNRENKALIKFKISALFIKYQLLGKLLLKLVSTKAC